MLDDLERALAAAEEHEEAKLEEGVRLVHRELAAALDARGRRRDRDGRRTSTRTSTRRCSRSPRTRRRAPCSRCVQKGYQLGDHVLRPARVVVAAAAARPMAPVKDLYETLGVAKCRRARTRSRRPTASSRASTTRTRTRATPPPRSASRRCRRAYDVLSDPEKRKQYDTFGSANGRGRAARPAASASRASTSRARPRRSGRPLRRPLRARAAGAPQAAARSARAATSRSRSVSRSRTRCSGVETTIPVELETACRECGGSGAKPGTAPTLCPECHGRGVSLGEPGLFALSQPCPRCRGNGTVIEDPCPNCRGTGRERRTKRYTVKIPAGVKDGSRIRLRGKGEAGWGGAEAGDLLRRHARHALEALHPPRRRPRRRRAGHLSRRPRSARRSRFPPRTGR